jgi:hypothetical protein
VRLHVRLNAKLSSGIHPQEHREETISHHCSTECDRENDGEDWYPSAAAQSPLKVAALHEQGNLKKWTARWKIHLERPEEEMEATHEELASVILPDDD